MKKHIFLSLLLFVSLQIGAWTSPVAVPSVGEARLRIVGQNAENYLTDLTASNSSCSTPAEFAAKTDKLANVFIALQADIVAICEVERNDEVLQYIVDAMNGIYGENVYTYITDGLYAEQSNDGYMALKSGYIYRKDKVTPSGGNTSPYRSGEYNARLRIQAFKENATGEMFTLSVNHFKAKSNSSDQGESTRLQNVSSLLTALGKIKDDPDIMIMGDLNAYTNEEPILQLIEAGYEEQLVRFDKNAYSYIYKGTKGLLDHAMANEPMAGQVTGAGVYHINTSGSYSYRYSDHDCYLVGLNLGNQAPDTTSLDVRTPMTAVKARKIMQNGVLYILVDDCLYDITGRIINRQ